MGRVAKGKKFGVVTRTGSCKQQAEMSRGPPELLGRQRLDVKTWIIAEWVCKEGNGGEGAKSGEEAGAGDGSKVDAK